MSFSKRKAANANRPARPANKSSDSRSARPSRSERPARTERPARGAKPARGGKPQRGAPPNDSRPAARRTFKPDGTRDRPKRLGRREREEREERTNYAARASAAAKPPGDRPDAPPRKEVSERTKRKRRRDGFDRRERAASGEKHPRAKKGPWSSNAYLPSPKVIPMDKLARQNKKPKVAPVVADVTDQIPPDATDDVATPAAATANPAKPGQDRKEERLQKVLARSGVASRRAAELLILEGAVTVNGRPITELGTKVDATQDKIKVHGSLIFTEVEPVFIALYKPRGMISALSDPEGRRHIGHIVKSIRERVIPIGRLDYNSEGLMLLTNDGNLAEGILKQRELPKIYMVKIKGHPTPEDLTFLKRGFFTADGVVKFASFGVEQTLRNKSWLKLEITEGSKLDLRELLNQKGLLVDRIVRTAIGGLNIHGLEPGEYRFLKRADFEKLLSSSNKS